jgi:hypothetical protein
LGKFPAAEADEIEHTVNRAADAVETWVEHGIQSAMNQFNADPVKRKSNKQQNDESKVAGSSDETIPNEDQ